MATNVRDTMPPGWPEGGEAASLLRLVKRPVAWRVKDFADGWIIFQDEAAAYKLHEETGCAMQGLYVRDGT